MRLAIDTGGTFTDLVVEEGETRRLVPRARARPSNPLEGVINVLEVAAADRDCSRSDLLAEPIC